MCHPLAKKKDNNKKKIRSDKNVFNTAYSIRLPSKQACKTLNLHSPTVYGDLSSNLLHQFSVHDGQVVRGKRNRVYR